MAIVSMLYGAGGASSAEDVSYDNTTSGLTADNVQDAIDEISTSKPAQHVDGPTGIKFDFIKMGNLVSVSVSGSTTKGIGLDESIGTIPVGFRPNINTPMFFYMPDANLSSQRQMCYLSFRTNGDILHSVGLEYASSNPRGTLVYLAK